MSDYPVIAVIRDIVVIIWGLLGILAFLVVIAVSLALFRMASPVLRSLRATGANLQVATTLVADTVARPLIRVLSFSRGIRQGVSVASRLLRRRR